MHYALQRNYMYIIENVVNDLTAATSGVRL